MAKLTPQQIAALDATPENRAATAPAELLTHVRFIGDIKHLLVDADYGYAEATLRGILATVETTQYVTAGQRRAVANIAAAPQRSGGRYSHRSSSRRRFEE